VQLKKVNLTTRSIPLYFYQSLASTNHTLRSLIEDQVQLPLAVMAQEQSSGRGQWGRIWESKTGGLYLSLGIELVIQPEHALHLSLITGWGVAEILNKQNIPVKLKWPNDLLLEGRKLGGIKIETCSNQQIISRIVIGIGINWQNTPPEGGINLSNYPTISSLDRLAQLTLEGLFLGIDRYLVQGIEGILPDYLTLLDSIGKSVEINGVTGVVKGVDQKGNLLVVVSSPGASCEISCIPGMISLGYD